MLTIPFASLSIHKFINSVGADVGFASIIAVALLVLLYFAHARETAALRDRLEEAHARIGGLEARLAQLMRAQGAAQRGRGPMPGAPVPPPAAVTQPGVTQPPIVTRPPQPSPSPNAIPSVRRIPSAVTAAGAGSVAPPPALAGAARPAVQRNGLAPAAPLGMAGPALASATKLIPVIALAANPAATEQATFAPAMANGNGGNGTGDETRALPTVAAAAASPQASPRAAATQVPPRMQIGADAPPASPRRTPPSSRPPLLDELGSERSARRRLPGRLLPLLIGGIAVVVIVVGLIVITNTGGSSTTNVPHNTSGSNQTGASLSNKQKGKAAAPFKASKVKVSVLNGTAVAGLAADVGNVLTGAGYRRGNITNAAVQTETSTFVYYLVGASTAANKTAARHVATTLKLPSSRVRAAGRSVLQSCATSASGASLGPCSANVVVSVGSDRANLAASNG